MAICANIFSHSRERAKKNREEGGTIESTGAEKRQPLTREQALAARDFSRAGEIFIDYKGEVNEILYSILTPLGYQVHISAQALQHIEKHLIAVRYKTNIPHILNNPDLIVPSYEFPTVHLYYKVVEKILLVVAVHYKDDLRFVATMHKAPTIKGMREKKILPADFLYIRGGFKWKRWK
jgi:hypothetical protein